MLLWADLMTWINHRFASSCQTTESNIMEGYGQFSLSSVHFHFLMNRNKRLYKKVLSYSGKKEQKENLRNECHIFSSYLTLRTMKEPSFIPSANCDPSGLKDTLRTASSMLQRAIKAWSARLHSLHQRKLKAVETSS